MLGQQRIHTCDLSEHEIWEDFFNLLIVIISILTNACDFWKIWLNPLIIILLLKMSPYLTNLGFYCLFVLQNHRDNLPLPFVLFKAPSRVACVYRKQRKNKKQSTKLIITSFKYIIFGNYPRKKINSHNSFETNINRIASLYTENA